MNIIATITVIERNAEGGHIWLAGQFMTSSLPILKKNHSGGDRVVLELVTLFPHFLGSQYPPVAFLFGGNSALNKFNQPNNSDCESAHHCDWGEKPPVSRDPREE